MEYIWLFFAFGCGLAAKSVSLPPSIGYLLAGFLLNFLGFQANENLQLLADLGITLMLFTIGLKLNIKDLLKNEVWLGCFSHTFIWLILGIMVFKIAAIMAIPYFADLTLASSAIIVFALSFSSTVCIIKLLEEQGEMKTRHAKVVVGILVVQDIIAVAFLVLATSKIPSIWALGLLALFLIKPFAFRLVSQAGHGELLPLSGFFLAFGAYALFEMVNIKGDLGALLIGMYFASHTKAAEITKSLLSFKDIFLIGFFLSIGFVALPTLEMLGLATLLVVILIPLKFVLFFGLFSLLKLRCRTSYLSALALSNFSEFGLIVAALSAKTGWLTEKWLVILALAVSLSFVITCVIYKYAHVIFSNKKAIFKKFERKTALPEDICVLPTDSPAIIIGMGRVGIGAYKAMATHPEIKVWGLDADPKKVESLLKQGINAYVGDAEDAYFWENIDLSKVKLILLAMPSVLDVEIITKVLHSANYQGQIAAIARYDDERRKMESFGIDKVFNFYTEAGAGFAEESFAMIGSSDIAAVSH